jgi:ABC-type phosphate/phosphonate transport system substrate-binding protein
MYDPPHMQDSNDTLWAAIRDRLRARDIQAPEALSRAQSDRWRIWRAPDLLLAQTCGQPFRSGLQGATTFIGTPDYGLRDCPPGHYRSAIVVRTRDGRQTPRAFDGARLAYNGEDSMSGWNAARGWALDHGISLKIALKSGSHAASAVAVADGRADIAAIDVQTWRLMEQGRAVPRGLRVLSHSSPSPGLPLISAAGRDPAPLRAAIEEAIEALPHDTRTRLGLRGLSCVTEQDYLRLP